MASIQSSAFARSSEFSVSPKSASWPAAASLVSSACGNESPDPEVSMRAVASLLSAIRSAHTKRRELRARDSSGSKCSQHQRSAAMATDFQVHRCATHVGGHKTTRLAVDVDQVSCAVHPRQVRTAVRVRRLTTAAPGKSCRIGCSSRKPVGNAPPLGLRGTPHLI